MRIEAGALVCSEVAKLEWISGIEVVRDETLPANCVRFPDGSTGIWPFDPPGKDPFIDLYDGLRADVASAQEALESIAESIDDAVGL